MDAEALVDEFAVRLGRSLSGHGFVPEDWRFRRTGPDGDVLYLEFQPSKAWEDDDARFYVNVHFVLRPLWDLRRAEWDLPEDEQPYGGFGRFLGRVTSANPYEGDLFRIADRATLDDLSTRVPELVIDMLPRHLWMLDRAALFERAEDEYGGGAWRVRAWILADRGPSAELDRLLADHPDDPETVALIRDHAAVREAAPPPRRPPPR